MSEVAASTPTSSPSSTTNSGPGVNTPIGMGQSRAPTSPPSAQSQQNQGQTPTIESTPKSGDPTAPSTPEYFEVKVNNKVMKMTRDEVIAHAQMSHAAQERFQEAAKMKKYADSMVQGFNTNPIQTMLDAGVPKEKIRATMEQWYSREFIEPETLSPQELESRRMKEQLEHYKSKEKQDQERVQKEEQQKLTQHHVEYMQKQIMEAMDKSGLPKTPFFVQRMAFYMRQNLVNGWDAPMDLIVSQVKNEEKERIGHLNKEAPIEYLMETLGEEVINKIRKWDLERLRQKRTFPQSSQNQTSSTNYQDRERLSSIDVDRRLRDIRMGKL